MHVPLLQRSHVMMFDRWYVFIIITFLIWGTQAPFLKMLSDELPPLLLNLLGEVERPLDEAIGIHEGAGKTET